MASANAIKKCKTRYASEIRGIKLSGKKSLLKFLHLIIFVLYYTLGEGTPAAEWRQQVKQQVHFDMQNNVKLKKRKKRTHIYLVL